MPAPHQSPAVTVARAHVDAWSHHDYDAARAGLAPDLHVTAITTNPFPPPADLTGADEYMTGLVQFARAVAPGSARIIAATGDDRNALLMLTVQADLGAGTVTLPGSTSSTRTTRSPPSTSSSTPPGNQPAAAGNRSGRRQAARAGTG